MVIRRVREHVAAHNWFATPSLLEEMTRYVASIDQKVEILTINLGLTEQFRDRLLETG